ncbi:hypothetical protein ISCGN_032240 [Ixodes scapularis]
MSSEQRHKLLELLRKFHDCFAAPSRVQQTTTAKHRIITNDDSRYKKCSVILASNDPWAAPAVLVEKDENPVILRGLATGN